MIYILSIGIWIKIRMPMLSSLHLDYTSNRDILMGTTTIKYYHTINLNHMISPF